MPKLPHHLWKAVVTMCRSDTRHPVFMKPLILLICLGSVIRAQLAGKPIELVAVVLLALLAIEYLLTLRSQITGQSSNAQR